LYVREGETAHLDLSTYVSNLNVMWTKKADKAENIATCMEGSGQAPAAIEISAITATTVNRAYFNPHGCNPGSNGFVSSADAGNEFLSKIAAPISYAVPVGTIAIRIKPIYAGATVSVSSATGVALKDQLYLIQSKALTTDVRKEIEVRRGLDAPPSIFDYAVFSAGTIVK